MQIPTYLLFLLGCLGAIDIALFHSVAHGIRSHADSLGELVTHSLRGPTYAVLFMFIPNFEMHGLFAWGLMALFVFDVGISIWDFSLEQGSRRFLGGLPSGEYVLHMLMAIVFGALVTTVLCLEYHWFSAPTRLVWAPTGAPAILRLALSIMAIAVLGSGIQDAAAALRLKRLVTVRNSRAPDQSTLSRQVQDLAAGSGQRVEAPTPARADGLRIPPWMKVALASSGVYNLVWGAWVVLFPAALFHWIGIPPANYPQIWQCLGMIVGVYGIGYLIAARDPISHWPIILVGLIGKILGPVGMWWSVAEGGLPAGMALVCVANDLIWWTPFALILARVLANQPKFGASRSDAATIARRFHRREHAQQ
jgi:hypothetical protein